MKGWKVLRKGKKGRKRRSRARDAGGREAIHWKGRLKRKQKKIDEQYELEGEEMQGGAI